MTSLQQLLKDVRLSLESLNLAEGIEIQLKENIATITFSATNEGKLRQLKGHLEERLQDYTDAEIKIVNVLESHVTYEEPTDRWYIRIAPHCVRPEEVTPILGKALSYLKKEIEQYGAKKKKKKS